MIDAYFAQFGAPAGNVKNSEALGFNADGSLFNVGPNPTAPHTVYNLIPALNSKGQPLDDVAGGSVHHVSYGQWEQYPLDRWSAFTKGDWALTKDIHFFGQALYTNYTSLLNVRTHRDQRHPGPHRPDTTIPSFRQRSCHNTLLQRAECGRPPLQS